jgi:hypothetical protein
MIISEVLEYFYPGAIWSLSGQRAEATDEDNYSRLDWVAPGPKPLLADLQARWVQLPAASVRQATGEKAEAKARLMGSDPLARILRAHIKATKPAGITLVAWLKQISDNIDADT